jgi:hypothetical protein
VFGKKGLHKPLQSRYFVKIMKHLLITLGAIALVACSKKSTTETPKATAATVTTAAITTFTQQTATLGGSVTADGGAEITERGICWDTVANPSKEDSFRIVGKGKGNFNISVNSLRLGKKYYVRAYAVNSAGISYGAQKSFTTVATLEIGLFYQGGYIFYLDPTKKYGWVCAEKDLTGDLKWGCPTMKITGAMGSNIGQGEANTSNIMVACSDVGTAADMSVKLISNGYDDWYLPSSGELDIIYDVLHKKGIGNFKNINYWSSTQSANGDGLAVMVNFLNGTNSDNGKDMQLSVRPIREF